MRLSTFHRILITSGIILGLLMIVFATNRWIGGDTSLAPTGVLGLFAVLALGAYLRWFNRKQLPRS